MLRFVRLVVLFTSGNDPVDFLAACLKEVYNDVKVEATLQPLEGEKFRLKSVNIAPDARADIRVGSFWRRSQSAFFDMRVFYPYARSYLARKSLQAVFQSHEKAKRREYGERILQVEHGSFTPLVFSAAGGMGPEAAVFVKKLASDLARKRGVEYANVISWLRCSLAYSLARSAIRCIRGSRSIKRERRPFHPVRLVMAESFLAR